MAKDKRMSLLISLPNKAFRVGPSYNVIIYDANSPAASIYTQNAILVLKGPISFSEIIMQLDLRCIKWKSITVEDNTVHKGIIMKGFFKNQPITYSKDIIKNHPDEAKDRELRIEKLLTNYYTS